MNIAGVHLGRLSPAERDRLLAAARSASPNYGPVGATLDPGRWDRAGVRAESLAVGRGPEAFAAAREAVGTWVAQRGIGADVIPADEPVVTGGTVLVVLRKGPIFVIAPDRIVGTIDEPRRFGFAYGTLPGHPERGEESFVVEHQADDTVVATIRVEAGPGTLAARLAAPAVLLIQRAALRGYLRGIAEHVRRTAAVPV